MAGSSSDEARHQLTFQGVSDSKSKAVFANPVPHKGTAYGPYGARAFASNLTDLGYRRVLMKKD